MVTATVARVASLTHDVRELELRLADPAAIEFEAGQFVSFKVATPRLPFPLTRPYSIASPPANRSSIVLLFNVVPDGPGSSYLDALRTGETVTFEPPAGTFTLRDSPERDLLFVATGTGIAPFLSMIPARLASPGGGRVRLVWGVRSERDLYYQEEFAALAAKDPRFSFVTTLSQPSSDWNGAAGRVQRIVEELVTSVEGLSVYLCGNSGMLDAVTRIVRARGLCPIRREQYYRDVEVASAL